MPWVSLTDAGFTAFVDYYFGGTGNFSVSENTWESAGGLGSSDNTFGLNIADASPFDQGGFLQIRLTCISFSVAAGGAAFQFDWNDGAPQTQLNESGTPNADFAPSPLVMNFGISGGASFAEFATTGVSDPCPAAEFYIEIFIPDPAPDPGDPLLVKTPVITEISPAVPARAAVPAVAFQMYAPPLPIGYVYNQYKSGGILYPNSAATFTNWSQLKLAPTEYSNTIAGYEFKTLAELIALYGSSFSPGSNWIARYAIVSSPSGDYQALTGYDIPRVVATELPPRYYGPIQHMTFVTFPGVSVASNGYPLGDGPFEGYFDVPTLDGVQRVTSFYDKDFRGVLLRRNTPALPAYCIQGGACRVVMLSNFPGRAAVDSIAAVLSVDDRAGWNSGANSILALDSDCETVFTPEITAAGAVGFAPSGRADVTKFENLTHAFYFDQAAGGFPQFAVIENGLRVWGPRRLTPAMEFKIARVAGFVTFSVDGATVYQSPTYLPGEIIVGTALYRAGDGVL